MQEAEAEANQCSLCPTTPAEIARRPDPPANQPFATLPCNHIVHTHCLVHTLCTRKRETSCGNCDARVLRQEDLTFYQHLYEDDYELHRRATVENLWQNSEDFRREILVYKKMMAKANTANLQYRRDLRLIKNEFKQDTITSVELIKLQKAVAVRKYKALESVKNYRRAGQAAERVLRRIRTLWDVDQWSLRNLNNIDGAPKIPRNRYFRWALTPRYLFRIRF